MDLTKKKYYKYTTNICLRICSASSYSWKSQYNNNA